MKKFWLYINPYIFIWVKDKKGIFYNSKNFKNFQFVFSGPIEIMVNQLLDIDNMYCIVLTEIEMQDYKVSRFVNKVILTKSGFLMEISDNKRKPVSFIPHLKFMNKLDKVENKSENIRDLDLYLRRSTFYINGKCKLNCKECDSIFKQIEFCTKSNYELSLYDLKKTLDRIQIFHLNQVDILGGNISEHSEYSELGKLLNSYSFKSNLYFQYLNFEEAGHMSSGLTQRINFILLVDSIKNFKLTHILKDAILKYSISWIFIMTSLEDYKKIQDIVKVNRLKNVQIKPFYNKRNLDFFKQYVFLNKKDILNLKLTKRDLFMNQVLNKYFFSKFVFSPNKKVYSNVNLESIGDLDEPIIELILKELVTENSWRKTRFVVHPCTDCLYKNLCPPVSNYEFAIGQYNLCNLKAVHVLVNT
jgi:pseudo-rSAM protein